MSYINSTATKMAVFFQIIREQIKCKFVLPYPEAQLPDI